MQNFEDILNSFINNEKTDSNYQGYATDAITQAAALLGNPQKKYKSVHIAGTNGKGTTAFYLHQLLRAHGYRTGLYTSPHLVSVHERIVIDNQISDKEAVLLYNKIESQIGDLIHRLTFFDLLTLIAFCYFAQEEVEYAVFECGLGGRCDSTNIIQPELSIITDISIDHTHILGAGLKEITSEKCGIIKEGVPLITTNQDDSVLSIIASLLKGNDIFSLNKDYTVTVTEKNGSGTVFSFNTDIFSIEDIHVPSISEVLPYNFCTALFAFVKLNIPPRKTKVLSCALHNVLPGRCEVLLHGPLLVYDVAHNYNALLNLIDTVNHRFPDRRIRLFFTLMKDKETDRIIDFLHNRISDLYYVLSEDKRSYKPSHNELFETIAVSQIREMLDHSEKSINIVTGTFRLYKEVTDSLTVKQ